MLFEDYIETVESCDALPPEAREAAADALAFAVALHEMFAQSGLTLPEEVDLDRLQTLIDGHLGELAAAAIMLSKLQNAKLQNTNLDVIKMLECVYDNFSNTEDGGGVPSFVVRGYLRLAQRVAKLHTMQEVREVVRLEDKESFLEEEC